MESFSSNLSSFQNSTEHTDWNCINFSMGPLIWSILSTPCAFVGLPACVWLLWVIMKGKQGASGSTIYVLNLTIMDLIFNMSIFPTTINFYYWQNDQYGNAAFVLYCFNLTGRPLFTVCMCMDCYMAVVYPVLFLKIKDSRYRLVVSAFIWSFTVVYGTIIIVYRELVIGWIPCAVAVVIISFCTFVILLTLRKPDPSGRRGVHPQKQKALHIITVSLVMTLVSYLPVVILNGVSWFLPLSIQEVACNIVFPTTVSSLFGSTVMALLYLENLGSFKNLKNFLHAPSHQVGPQGQLRPTG